MEEQHRTETTAVPPEIWQERASAHARRADALTRDHVDRRARGEKHPVEDFLYTYYNLTPAQLRRWHPGAGVLLASADERRDWKWYVADGGSTRVDAEAFLAARRATVDYVEDLLAATMRRPPSFGCFGLHEWAMVYQLSPDEIRHRGLPLRLGARASDQVVESHPIRCSHFDAFRFFTPAAVPLNELQPTRANQTETEQSGCLHAGMDVYKWAMKLGPLIPGEVLLDAFELARDIRVVDMQASPYDVSGFGLPAIPVETAEGKRQYASLQRGFTERGDALRRRVLEAIRRSRLAAHAPASAMRVW